MQLDWKAAGEWKAREQVALHTMQTGRAGVQHFTLSCLWAPDLYLFPLHRSLWADSALGCWVQNFSLLLGEVPVGTDRIFPTSCLCWLHTCSPCLESICPQHYLEKSPMCVSYGCAELHKWNKAIKEGQEFLPDAARSPYSQREASMFALRYWNKKLLFTRLPYLLAPSFSLVFWRAVSSD